MLLRSFAIPMASPPSAPHAATPLTSPSRLILPCESPQEWSLITAALQRPLRSLSDLDALLTHFASASTGQICRFFATIPPSPEGSKFDWDAFWSHGVPFMTAVALEMPSLFAAADLPLLLQYENGHVELSRRQCACLLAHSFFGSITESARRVRKEKWAFRAAQLFFLEALPSALCFLNYFKLLGLDAGPHGAVSLRRLSFPRKCPPWKWEGHDHVMCPVEIVADGRIEDSSAPLHVDFANKFVGGGCLENDFNMEEILFAVKPELIVAMALCSYLQDEEVLRISGAIQYSRYTGYASTFEFEGDCDLYRQEGGRLIPDVVAMDALQGCAKIQFGEGLIRRDLDKARLAFDGEGRGACAVATGNWGCGAFGNDHTLKFLQQWLASSSAGVPLLEYHTCGDKRAAGLGGACRFQKNFFLASFQFGHELFICSALLLQQPTAGLVEKFGGSTVGQLWAAVAVAAKQCPAGPQAAQSFRDALGAS